MPEASHVYRKIIKHEYIRPLHLLCYAKMVNLINFNQQCTKKPRIKYAGLKIFNDL